MQNAQGSPLTGNIIAACRAKFEADRTEGLANLSIYLNSPIGVGEHPNIIADCVKLIEQISTAEENLKTMEKLFNPPVEASNDREQD